MTRTLLIGITALALASPAVAQDAPKEFPLKVTSQDEAAIRAICDYARQSQGINLETAQQVSGYCIGFLGRIGATSKEAVSTAAPKKKE